jgi:hypothetical protein
MQAHQWHNIITILSAHIEQSLVALAIYGRQNNALNTLNDSTLYNLFAVAIEGLIIDM